MAWIIAVLIALALVAIWFLEILKGTPDSERSVTLPGLLAGVAVVAGIVILLG